MAYCHTYLKPLQRGMLTSYYADPTFTKLNFLSEKEMRWRKRKDFKSKNRRLIRIWRQLQDMSRHERHALAKSKNRQILLAVLPNMRYLARQTLPLRGDWNTGTMSEENSNFHQLLKKSRDH